MRGGVDGVGDFDLLEYLGLHEDALESGRPSVLRYGAACLGN